MSTSSSGGSFSGGSSKIPDVHESSGGGTHGGGGTSTSSSGGGTTTPQGGSTPSSGGSSSNLPTMQQLVNSNGLTQLQFDKISQAYKEMSAEEDSKSAANIYDSFSSAYDSLNAISTKHDDYLKGITSRYDEGNGTSVVSYYKKANEHFSQLANSLGVAASKAPIDDNGSVPSSGGDRRTERGYQIRPRKGRGTAFAL